MFSFANREVKVSASMPLEEAEYIAKQYPGRYVDVIEEPEPPVSSIEEEAIKETLEAFQHLGINVKRVKKHQ